MTLAGVCEQNERDRAEAITVQLPHLYALATALDAAADDDIVQETITTALADPDVDTSYSGLAAVLERVAAARRPEVESPVAAVPGSDPDADAAELFYPDFYTEGPDAGGWVDASVFWGAMQVLRPDDVAAASELHEVADAALAEQDPLDVALLTLVDLEGAPFALAVLELDLSSTEARKRLARARRAVRAALGPYLRA